MEEPRLPRLLLKMQGQGHEIVAVISYAGCLLHSCCKTLDRNNWNGEDLFQVTALQGLVQGRLAPWAEHHGENSMWQRGNLEHREKEMTVLSWFPLWPSAHGLGLSIFMGDFLPLVNPICKCLQIYPQSCTSTISSVIINPVKLTVWINSHRFTPGHTSAQACGGHFTPRVASEQSEEAELLMQSPELLALLLGKAMALASWQLAILCNFLRIMFSEHNFLFVRGN